MLSAENIIKLRIDILCFKHKLPPRHRQFLAPNGLAKVLFLGARKLGIFDRIQLII